MTDEMKDRKYMELALELALKGCGKVDPNPLVGAVIVKDGKIIGRGYHTEYGKLHAEREALADCGSSPEGAVMYVTLEPCVMCAGLMHQARVDRCVYGAADPKAGALGTLYAVNADERLNHTFEAVSGVLGDECAELLRSFFARKRKKRMESK